MYTTTSWKVKLNYLHTIMVMLQIHINRKTKLVLTSSIITFVCVLQVLVQFLSVLHTHMHMQCLWYTNTCNNDIVEAHCYFVDIGRTDREQIRSRINNNDCRTFRPRRPLSTAYRTCNNNYTCTINCTHTYMPVLITNLQKETQKHT